MMTRRGSCWHVFRMYLQRGIVTQCLANVKGIIRIAQDKQLIISDILNRSIWINAKLQISVKIFQIAAKEKTTKFSRHAENTTLKKEFLINL